MAFAGYVILFFSAWTMLLSVKAISLLHNISTKRAAAAVMIPVIIILIIVMVAVASVPSYAVLEISV